jgi:simple sugar transport system permease protein
MRIEIVRRPERSRLMAVASPFLALLLTAITGFVIFAVVGVDPLRAMSVYFVEPLTNGYDLQNIIIKSAPIILIAVGLSFCYQSNTWNIGAEGQFIAGAVAGSVLPILFPEWHGPLVLPLMLLMGIAGGMLYAAIPAALKIVFGANEILSSLMLVYVAQFVLDWLARGPWRNPAGYNFPDSRPFDEGQVLPVLFGKVHLGIVFVLIAVVVAWLVLRRSLFGFEIRVLGQSPRAAAFAGFSRKRVILAAFLISGGLAGLAGIAEVAGPIGMLRVSVSPGYGFTAIIVAFLGRLNPVGILFAGLLLGLTYIGGEGVQIVFGLSEQITRVFQGMLLFYVLVCDSFILHRLRFVRTAPSQTAEAPHGAG